jgi:hypothetical protein
MVRRTPQPEATREEVLECRQQTCPVCGGWMWNKYDNIRRVRTLDGVVQLRLKVRRCATPECERFCQPYRPEAEGRWALPQSEMGLDVIALVGSLRYQEHRSVPQIHQVLERKGVKVSERTVSNLLARYDELVALQMSDGERIGTIVAQQGQVILAIDGLQPDMGHEVLWVIRDVLSGEILLCKPLLSSSSEDLAPLVKQVKQQLSVPIVAVVSDGQCSIRKAVAQALPEVAHGLCHFHYLREAAKPIYEADRHAKKELKKRVRGVRKLERTVSQQPENSLSEVAEGYCQAVRAALSDHSRPPLDAAGLTLHKRLSAIDASLERVGQKGGCPNP